MSRDLAALVGSRICHDLISPIGAIGNGVELLALTGGETAAEVNLITESVENANARIRFFRIAFGAAAADQLIGNVEVRSILTALAQGGRFEYDWQIKAEQSRQLVRAAFLALLCVETAMPLGGEITISQQADQWVITATGRRINVDTDLWHSLTGDTLFNHSAAQVQFALLPDILAQTDRRIMLQSTDTSLVVQF